MKKRLMLTVLSFFIILSVSAFAEEGTFLLEKYGDFRKFATYHELIPTPNHGSVNYYQNFGIMDKDGNVIAQPVYELISAPAEGRALFKKDGKYGYFDENWEEVIPAIYSHANNFSEGLACTVDAGGKYGFIDKDGNVILPHTLDYAESFRNGLATVGKVDKGYYDHTFIRTGKWDREGRQIEGIGYKWEDSYDVQMSANGVRINGTQYKNSDLSYPFINYLGYTYIPLTYRCTRKLGFACDWTKEKGLVLRNVKEDAGSIEGKNDMVSGKMYKASIYKGALTIGNETYFAEDVYYPILSYRDVVYIPVLWKQGMEGLGLKYSYDGEAKSLVFEKIN